MEPLTPRNAPQPALVTLDPGLIKADPATYQFRSRTINQEGETAERKIKDNAWNPLVHGQPMIVHERLNGDIYVVDGHHRLAFAKRLMSEGKGPASVPAYILKEADGYTPQDAKMVAAFVNIQQKKATLPDMVRTLRDARNPDIHHHLLPALPMERSDIAQAEHLSHLPEDVLRIVEEGMLNNTTPAKTVYHPSALPVRNRAESSQYVA